MGKENYQGKLDVPYLSVDEFFRDATHCTITADVQRQLEEEREAQGPLDPDALRRAEDWNALSNLVVGKEHLGPQTFP